MRIRRDLLVKILEENPDAIFLNLDIKKLAKQSYIDNMADLSCIYAICVSDLDESEKIEQIKALMD